MKTSELSFPDGFLWGAATAAYQIEGSVQADGRGQSIWDVFSSHRGSVRNGETGKIACDHYQRHAEDVALMSELGLRAYRFSIAWPRIQPSGSGQPNAAGLDFYDRLVDDLLSAGIHPIPTLYHWDLPQALEEAGGWQARDTASRFEAYAAIIASSFADRIDTFVTVNEPWVASHLGYGFGIHAPGLRRADAALSASHHMLLAHGLALRTIRAIVPGARVGAALNLTDVVPASAAPRDVEAAERLDGDRNRLFLEPLLTGRYPADMVAWFGSAMFPIEDGDTKLISAAQDFLGVNYYTREHVRARRDDDPAEPHPQVGAASLVPDGVPQTAMGWGVEPDGLRNVLLGLTDRYPRLPALLITENGAAFDDRVEEDGSIDDVQRIDYIDRHLRATRSAIDAGANVMGYLCWSLLDNFEWTAGYGPRFGLVRVDYETQIRTPKRSARWYAQVIAANGLPESPI